MSEQWAKRACPSIGLNAHARTLRVVNFWQPVLRVVMCVHVCGQTVVSVVLWPQRGMWDQKKVSPVKYSRARAALGGRKASKPTFRGLSLTSSSRKWLLLKSARVIVYLPEPLAHSWWWVKRVGRRCQVPLYFVLVLRFLTGEQTRLCWNCTGPGLVSSSN